MMARNCPGWMVPETFSRMTLGFYGSAFLLQHFLCCGMVLISTSSKVS